MRAERAVTEHKARLSTIRVAIKKTRPGARSFSVERLDAHQCLPPGAVEALLVLADNAFEPVEPEGDPS
jgi:hypothetical protein